VTINTTITLALHYTVPISAEIVHSTNEQAVDTEQCPVNNS